MTKIKRSQIWKEKNGKKAIQILRKSTGNGHWTIKRIDKKSNLGHRIHEGTLNKFYQLLCEN